MISHKVHSKVTKPERGTKMTDRYKVYTKVQKTLDQIVKLHHPGHVVTLAMMITGIVMSKKAQLSEMSSEIPGKAKDKSREMRLRRWVKHEKLEAEMIYLFPIIPAITYNFKF